MIKHLHIISLTIPYPVDYGGVFDLYYKLIALHRMGVHIYLHCFKYGREEQKELEKYCAKVFYYPRNEGIRGFDFSIPYIVNSRRNEDLLLHLMQDNYPILMEGTHCTYLLNDNRFANRSCFVRLHNIEHLYYRHLYKYAGPGLQKMYYWWESVLLKKYEKHIANKATFWTVIEKDAAIMKKLGAKQVRYMPLFLPEWKVQSNVGQGTFCLYQGDLSVYENELACRWLLTNVFDKLKIPFVIAGKNPSKGLKERIEINANTCLVANPAEEEMQDMIAKAHVIIIPSYNTTGIKLKLLNALYNGRHCLVNTATVDGTGLESLCVIAEEASEFVSAIDYLYVTPFTENEMEKRAMLLNQMFDNHSNASSLVAEIFD